MKKKALRAQAISWFGWYGVAAILAAYTLLSFEAIEASSYTYQLLNLTGAFGIMAQAAAKGDKQPVVLNVVWAAVAVVAIGKLLINA